MQALIVSVSDLKWGEHDTQDEMLGRALSYLVLFSTLGMILRWSVGVKLLSVADDDAEATMPDAETAPKAPDGSIAVIASPPVVSREEEQMPLIFNDQDQSFKRRSAHFPVSDDSDDDQEHTNPGAIEGNQRKKARTQDYFRSFPNTPTWRTPATSSKGSASSDEDDPFSDNESPQTATTTTESEWGVERGVGMRSATKPSRSVFQSKMRRSWSKTRKIWLRWIFRPTKKFVKAVHAFMTVPL